MIDYLTELLRELLTDLECYLFHADLFSGDRPQVMKTSAVRNIIRNVAVGKYGAVGHHGLYEMRLSEKGVLRYRRPNTDATEARYIDSIDLAMCYMETLSEYEEIRRALFAMNECGEMKKTKQRTNIIIK